MIRVQKKTHRKTFKTKYAATAYADSLRQDWRDVGVWDLTAPEDGKKGFMVFCIGKLIR